MSDEVENLVLEHLERMQAELDRVRKDQRTHSAELSSVRQMLGAQTTLLHQSIEDMAAMRARLDPIERRLDLVDAE